MSHHARDGMLVDTAELERIRDEIAGWFNGLYAGLSQLADEAGDKREPSRRADAGLSVTERKAIRRAAESFLASTPAPEAAGVIFSPGILGDEGDIEWWQREEDGSTSRVPFTLTPQTAGFYDFETLEWFRNAVETGRPTLTGPYVDYAGMDQYILTLTVPLTQRESIWGLAGCDIKLSSLETALMPSLRRLRADLALVSRANRIVLGNSGRFLVGNRLADIASHGLRVDVPSHDLGLSLVAVPRETTRRA